MRAGFRIALFALTPREDAQSCLLGVVHPPDLGGSAITWGCTYFSWFYTGLCTYEDLSAYNYALPCSQCYLSYSKWGIVWLFSWAVPRLEWDWIPDHKKEKRRKRFIWQPMLYGEGGARSRRHRESLDPPTGLPYLIWLQSLSYCSMTQLHMVLLTSPLSEDFQGIP